MHPRLLTLTISLLALLLPCLLFSQTPQAVTVYATGVDSSGLPLPDQSVDPHYSLINAPVGSGLGPSSFVGSNVTNWVPNNGSGQSKWIGPTKSFANIVPVGVYVYRTTFNLTGQDPSQTTLTGRWLTATVGIVQLNGITISNNTSPTSWKSLSIQSAMNPGLNTLDFVVTLENGQTSTGLRVELTGTTVSCSNCGGGGGGGGITSINGLTAGAQNLVASNDSNVTMSITSLIATHTFALGWSGQLAKNRQYAGTVYNDSANTMTGASSFDFTSTGAFKVKVSTVGDSSAGSWVYNTTISGYQGGTGAGVQTMAGVGACLGGNQVVTGTLTNGVNCTQLASTQLSDSGSLMRSGDSAGGDLSGTYRNPTVSKVNGTSVSTTSAANQIWLTTASGTMVAIGVPACLDVAGNHLNFDVVAHAFSCGNTSSGGGSGGATAASQLTDWSFVRSTGTVLSIGSTCTSSTPCNIRIGSNILAFTTGPWTATWSSGATDTAYFYVDQNGILTVGTNTAVITPSSGLTAVTGVTGFPNGSTPIEKWSIATSVWAATGTDQRGWLGNDVYDAGPNITISYNPSTGHRSITAPNPSAFPFISGTSYACGGPTDDISRDDTTCFQQMITDSVNAAHFGATLTLPPNIFYEIKAPIIIQDVNGLTVQGNANSTQIHYYLPTVSTLFKCGSCFHVTFKDLYIIATSAKPARSLFDWFNNGHNIWAPSMNRIENVTAQCTNGACSSFSRGLIGTEWSIASTQLTSIVVNMNQATVTLDSSIVDGLSVGSYVVVYGSGVSALDNNGGNPAYQITSTPTTHSFTFTTFLVSNGTYNASSLAVATYNDANGDFMRYEHVTVFNTGGAAITIEGTQQHDIQLENVQVYCSGSGTMGTTAISGRWDDSQGAVSNFHWNNGYSGNCANEDVHMGSAQVLPYSVSHTSHENSNRFLVADGPAGAGQPFVVDGVRWAPLGLNADGRVINFYNPGPLVIRNSRLGDAISPSANPNLTICWKYAVPLGTNSPIQPFFTLENSQIYTTATTVNSLFNVTSSNSGCQAPTKAFGTSVNTNPSVGSYVSYGLEIDGRGAVKTALSSTPYTISQTDKYISVDTVTIGGASTLTLFDGATYNFTPGTEIIVKDSTGAASSSNITINCSGCSIDGAGSKVINTAYGYYALRYDRAANWVIVAQH